MRNKEKLKQNAKNYRESNPDRVIASRKNWSKNNPLKVKYSSKKATCKNRGIAFNISLGEFVLWWNDQRDKCFYCGNDFSGKSDMQLDRKNPDLGYCLDNIVLCCSLCNRAKSDIFSFYEWLDIVEKYKLSERFRHMKGNI